MGQSGEADRWDRSRRVGWLDVDSVLRSHCLVVGAGALGNETVKNLVLSGVGKVTLVDMDHVELSNLNRCLFFSDVDASGRVAKAGVVAQGAMRLSPHCEILPLVSRIEDTDLEWGMFDVVFGCLDNIKARLHLNSYSRHHGIPYVDAGTDGSRGKLQVVLREGPCLQCSMNRSHYQVLERRFSCTGEDFSYYEPPMAAEVTTTATMAAMQVKEGLKIISNKEDGCIRDVMFYDALRNETLVLELEIDEDCPNHGM